MINYPPGLPDQTKVCFGQFWDANAPQCKGGLDPSVMSTDGTAMHRRCDWFAKCAAETIRQRTHKKGSAQPTPQPVTSPIAPPMQSLMRGVAQGARQALIKHVSQPVAPVVQHPVHPQMAQQQQQPYYGQPGPIMVHPAQAAVPYMVPMNYQSPGMQMPGYLTNPEPPVEGQHWAVRLFYNVIRSMGKAGMHTGANFLDHTTINTPVYYPPTPPEQPPQG